MDIDGAGIETGTPVTLVRSFTTELSRSISTVHIAPTKVITFFNNFSRYVTNEIILSLCPANCWITPGFVILPSRKQLYCTGNSYIALPKLLYHFTMQLFCILIISGLKFKESIDFVKVPRKSKCQDNVCDSFLWIQRNLFNWWET